MGEVSPSLRPGRAALQISIKDMRVRSSATPSWVTPKKRQLQESTTRVGAPKASSCNGNFHYFVSLLLCHSVTFFLRGTEKEC
jgi:hypothetical protein